MKSEQALVKLRDNFIAFLEEGSPEHAEIASKAFWDFEFRDILRLNELFYAYYAFKRYSRDGKNFSLECDTILDMVAYILGRPSNNHQHDLALRLLKDGYQYYKKTDFY